MEWINFEKLFEINYKNTVVSFVWYVSIKTRRFFKVDMEMYLKRRAIPPA